MFRIVLSFFLILTSFSLWATSCKVSGISDSPQKLSCLFNQESIELTCVNGHYFLNNILVEQTYHLEVEEGSNPLVFKSRDQALTVVGTSKNEFSAEYARKGVLAMGSCH